MKIYIILALVAFTSATEWKLKTSKEFDDIEKKCKQQHKLSEELVDKVKLEKYPPKETFELGLCMLRGAGFWSDSEGFSVDGLVIAVENVTTDEDNIDKELLRDRIKSCTDSNSEGSTPLDWAYRCYKCFVDNEELYYILNRAILYKVSDSSEEE